MKSFREKDGIDNDDVDLMERSMIIQKSVQEVKKRAQDLNKVRHSPHRYKEVKSKVTRNLKVQQHVSKKIKKAIEDERYGRTSPTRNDKF